MSTTLLWVTIVLFIVLVVVGVGMFCKAGEEASPRHTLLVILGICLCVAGFGGNAWVVYYANQHAAQIYAQRTGQWHLPPSASPVEQIQSERLRSVMSSCLRMQVHASDLATAPIAAGVVQLAAVEATCLRSIAGEYALANPNAVKAIYALAERNGMAVPPEFRGLAYDPLVLASW